MICTVEKGFHDWRLLDPKGICRNAYNTRRQAQAAADLHNGDRDRALRLAADALERALAEPPPPAGFDGRHMGGARAARRAALDMATRRLGGDLRDVRGGAHGARLRLLEIYAGSTEGPEDAIANWIARVRVQVRRTAS
jgi:hypothetical protein